MNITANNRWTLCRPNHSMTGSNKIEMTKAKINNTKNWLIEYKKKRTITATESFMMVDQDISKVYSLGIILYF